MQPTNVAVFKKHKSFQKPDLTPKIEVTSYPSPPSVRDPQIPPNWVEIPQDHSPFRTPDFEETHLAQKHIIPWIPDNLTVEPSPKERNCSIVSFSSTGSCEMYSSSNNSDDEDNGPSNSSVAATQSRSVSSKLSKAALTTIELILRKLELYLNHAAYLQCVESSERQLEDAMNTVTISKGSANRNRNTNNNTHASQSNTNTNKRKSRQTDDPVPHPSNTNSFYSNNQNNADSDNEDDPNNKRRRVSVTTTNSDSEHGPKFACPFYKHDPGRYRTHRTCPGPGWRTVHRMKEHLYRAHGQSIHCPRCYTTFNSDVELSTHLRASSCPTLEALPVEGIDRETLDKLRKRTPANRLEEDKWRDAYLLLFPDVDPADCPSPCESHLLPFIGFNLKSLTYSSCKRLYASFSVRRIYPLPPRTRRSRANRALRHCRARIRWLYRATPPQSIRCHRSTLRVRTARNLLGKQDRLNWRLETTFSDCRRRYRESAFRAHSRRYSETTIRYQHPKRRLSQPSCNTSQSGR